MSSKWQRCALGDGYLLLGVFALLWYMYGARHHGMASQPRLAQPAALLCLEEAQPYTTKRNMRQRETDITVTMITVGSNTKTKVSKNLQTCKHHHQLKPSRCKKFWMAPNVQPTLAGWHGRVAMPASRTHIQKREMRSILCITCVPLPLGHCGAAPAGT